MINKWRWHKRILNRERINLREASSAMLQSTCPSLVFFSFFLFLILTRNFPCVLPILYCFVVFPQSHQLCHYKLMSPQTTLTHPIKAQLCWPALLHDTWETLPSAGHDAMASLYLPDAILLWSKTATCSFTTSFPATLQFMCARQYQQTPGSDQEQWLSVSQDIFKEA